MSATGEKKSSHCVSVIQSGEVDFWRLRDVRETKQQASVLIVTARGTGRRRINNIIHG